MSGHRSIRSDSWTQAILNSSYDAFIAIDARGRIIDWNPQAEKTFGWRRDEVLGVPLHQTIIPSHHRAAHQRGMKHFFATGEGPVLNKRIQIDSCHRDGREIPIELTIYPVGQGENLVFGAFLHDISERKRADQLQQAQLSVTNLLTESLSLNEAIPLLLQRVCKNFDWSAGDFWTIDPQKDALACSYVWTDSEILQDFKISTQSSTFARGKGLPGRVWVSGQATWIENLAADGNFPRTNEAVAGGLKSALAFPIRVDDQMIGVVGFYTTKPQKPDAQLLALMNDIGQRFAHFISRRRAEESLAHINQELEHRVEERTQDLARANAQLQSASRLKDEFLATVSHELRTPLNVIQGHSELLLNLELPTEDRESVEAIHRNAKVQGHIISDLLDVSRIISGKLQLEITSIHLAQVIDAALESIRIAAASKNIEVAVESPSPVGLISGDFNRLQQVLWNLLTNAVKFTPKGGRIKVVLREIDSKAQILVADTGKGIEPAFLPHVFERFRQEDATTTRHFGGLGLGLAIARHIVEAHGGVIEAASEGKDKGTSFTVTVPFLSVRPESSKPLKKNPVAEGPFADQTLSGVRALVIDDQEDTRTMIRQVLKRYGAQVSLAASAAQAFESIAEQQPDVIVSDIGMPDEDGYSFMQRLRKLDPSRGGDVPALALTAYAHELDRQRALSSGFQVHLSKPIDAKQLVNEISKLVR